MQSCTHTILFLRLTQGRRNDSQAITDIIKANQQHLELLRLDLPRYDQRDPVFLPPNLKYLFASCNEPNGDELMSDLAAEQCPKLCGVEFHGKLTLRTINTIPRFEKFVAYLLFNYYYIWILYKIIV